jgi:hypothetical protein
MATAVLPESFGPTTASLIVGGAKGLGRPALLPPRGVAVPLGVLEDFVKESFLVDIPDK